MIGYVTLGTNRYDEAASFYDELFATIGAGRLFETDRFIAWGTGMTSPAVSIARPYDGKPATVGNGVMVALVMDSTDKVDALHAKALELGAERLYFRLLDDRVDGDELAAGIVTGDRFQGFSIHGRCGWRR